MTRKKHIGTCYICYTNIKTIISPCGCSICPSCWSQMIITKIQETNSVPETITCPIEKCLKQLSITTLSSKLPRPAQDEINQATLKVYLSKTSDIRQCPSTKCNYAGIIDTSSSCSDNLCCRACGTTWRDKIHYTTSEKIQYSFNNMTTQRNEIFSELWKKLRTKECPKCHISITKSGGCDHMTCSKCGSKFCWTCLQSFGYRDHNKSLHNFEAIIKPIIFLLIFLLMLFALYLLPPVNFVIHATVIPTVQWCWLEIFGPIIKKILSVIKYCWPFLKVLRDCLEVGLCQAIFEFILK